MVNKKQKLKRVKLYCMSMFFRLRRHGCSKACQCIIHSPLIQRHSTANGVTLRPHWEYVGIGLEQSHGDREQVHLTFLEPCQVILGVLERWTCWLKPGLSRSLWPPKTQEQSCTLKLLQCFPNMNLFDSFYCQNLSNSVQ